MALTAAERGKVAWRMSGGGHSSDELRKVAETEGRSCLDLARKRGVRFLRDTGEVLIAKTGSMSTSRRSGVTSKQMPPRSAIALRTGTRHKPGAGSHIAYLPVHVAQPNIHSHPHGVTPAHLLPVTILPPNSQPDRSPRTNGSASGCCAPEASKGTRWTTGLGSCTRFPIFVFREGQELRLHSGVGKDGKGDLHWGLANPAWGLPYGPGPAFLMHRGEQWIRMSTTSTERLYALVRTMSRYDHQTPKSDLPSDGIYLFFEKGEQVEIHGALHDRIVRVGTRREDSRFPGASASTMATSTPWVATERPGGSQASGWSTIAQERPF